MGVVAGGGLGGWVEVVAGREITVCAGGEIYLQDCDKPWHCGISLEGFLKYPNLSPLYFLQLGRFF